MSYSDFNKYNFFKRIMFADTKTNPLLSKEFISLALNGDFPQEFSILKASTAYAVACWDHFYDKKDYYDMGFFQRALDASSPEELKVVIEDFMNTTGFPDKWEKWTYEEIDNFPPYK